MPRSLLHDLMATPGSTAMPRESTELRIGALHGVPDESTRGCGWAKAYEKLIVGLLLLAAVPFAFAVIGRWNAGRAAAPPEWLLTRFDRYPRILPWSVWFYLSWYPASACPLLMDRRRFRSSVQAYLIAIGICFSGYVLLPWDIARPAPVGTGGIAGSLLSLLYAVDPPTNIFPSLHAAVAVILASLPTRPAAAALGWAWAACVCLSCVCTGQHYVVDVLAGMLVGVISTGIANATRPAVPVAGFERVGRRASRRLVRQ